MIEPIHILQSKLLIDRPRVFTVLYWSAIVGFGFTTGVCVLVTAGGLIVELVRAL